MTAATTAKREKRRSSRGIMPDNIQFNQWKYFSITSSLCASYSLLLLSIWWYFLLIFTDCGQQVTLIILNYWQPWRNFLHLNHKSHNYWHQIIPFENVAAIKRVCERINGVEERKKKWKINNRSRIVWKTIDPFKACWKIVLLIHFRFDYKSGYKPLTPTAMALIKFFV